MRKYIAIAVLLILAALLAVSCSDRGTNVPDAPKEDVIESWAINPLANHVFTQNPNDPTGSPQLLFQVKNRDHIQEMTMYVPRVAFPPPTGEMKRVPLLILLAPQYGSKYFYFDHGLLQIAQELMAEGKIQPMIICCLSSDQVFGGYFYGNSYPAGYYDDIIASPDEQGLVAFLNGQYSNLIDSASKRGIGGIGLGAYGAYRAILKHPGMFGSISVADGPLDFDGADGHSGLMNLFDVALQEQGLTPANFPTNFDSSTTWPVTSMFIGGGLAFSPHDTLLDYDLYITGIGGNARDTTEILDRYTLDDTISLISGIIKEDQGSWEFHVPFDGSGNVNQPIWDMWMNNDLATLLTDAGAGALNGVNQWIATSQNARFGFHEMTESWVTTLRTDGYTPELYEYDGYEGNPAQGSEYVYDLLREMLIFHSQNFGD